MKLRSRRLGMILMAGCLSQSDHVWAQAASTCAKASVVVGSGCGNLTVEFDLTACGGDKREAQLESCENGAAVASVTANGKKYAVNLTGKGWAGRLKWSLGDTITETTLADASKSRRASTVARAVAVTPSPGKRDSHVATRAKAEKPAVLLAQAAPVTPAPKEEVAAPQPQPVVPPEPVAPQATSKASPDLPPLVWSGDFRYRSEAVQQEKAAVDSYRQDRIRARLGLKAVVDDNVNVEVRIATGGGRASTNQTLGASESAFNNYDFKLDRAYFNWAVVNGVNILAGKQPNPFFLAGGSDLVWDSDVNFDGGALTSKASSGGVEFFADAAYYWLDKSTSSGKRDVILNVAQVGVNTKDASWANVGLGATMYKYRGLNGHKGFGSNGDTGGNSSVTVDQGAGPTKLYAKDYRLVDVAFEISTPKGMFPATLFIEHVRNLEVDDHDEGRIAGFKVGKLKAKGDWSLGYDYRVLEKDATIGAFTDGDSFGGGVDGRGHRVSASYQPGKNWNVAATYLDGEAKVSSGPLKRRKTMLDFNFKF